MKSCKGGWLKNLMSFAAMIAAFAMSAITVHADVMKGYPDAFVEYVGSDGHGQYVLTDIVFNDNTRPPRIIADAMITSKNDADILGTGGSVSGCIIVDYRLSDGKLWYRYGNTSTVASTLESTKALLNTWTRFDWGTSVYHDGTYILAQNNFNFTQNVSPLRLGNSRSTSGSVLFREVWIMEGDEQIAHLMPAKKDGEPCMFDAMSGKLYFNGYVGSTLVCGDELDRNFIFVRSEPTSFGSPDEGLHFYESSSSVTFALPSADGWYLNTNGIQRAKLDYCGVTDSAGVETRHTELPFSVSPSGSMGAVWKMKDIEDKMVLSAGAGGLVRAGDSSAAAELTVWQPEDEVACITAVPDSSHSFCRWTGPGTNRLSQAQLVEPSIRLSLTDGIELSATFGSVIYVETDGDDQNDGTVGHPLATVAEAFTRASPGTEVRLGAGTYVISATLALPAGVRFVGVAGAENTVIQPTSNFTPMINATSGGFVSGITFTGSTKLPAVTMADGTVFRDCIVRNGKNGSNPAVNMTGGSLIGCVITNCNAGSAGSSGGSRGGGVGMSAGLIDSCFISNNTDGAGGHSNYGGAGVFMTGGTLRNSLITGNYASKVGSGVRMNNGAIENCTIADNGTSTAKDSSNAGLFMAGGTVVNTIIWGNSNFYGLNNIYKTGGTITTSCSQPAADGEGNIETDPMFADAANGDYSIGFSAAVDHGTAFDWHLSSFDLAGEDRVMGSAVDLGCYEFQSDGLACSFSVDTVEGHAPLTVHASALVAGDTSGISYKWTFSDGENNIVVNGQSAMAEITLPAGRYGVTLEVSNSAGDEATSVRPALILSSPPVVFVDAANGENAKFPYATAATATSSISDALTACIDGCEIRVKGGTYSYSEGVFIKNGMRLLGVDGPENTVVTITSPVDVSIAFELQGEGTEMAGITLENAYQQMLKVGTGSVVTNCVFRNKSWVKNYTAAAAVQIAGGTLVDCVITNCNGGSAGTTGSSKGGGVYLVSGFVDRCYIVNNTDGTGTHNTFGGGGGIYVENGTVRNSLIAGNKGALHGSGIRIDNGSVENCTVAYNANLLGKDNRTAGLCMYGGTIMNSIIWGNSNYNGLNNIYKTAGTVETTCSMPLPDGEENISSDPMFEDVATGDYRIGFSASVDHGEELSWHADAVDMAGMPRVSGTAVDLGCYEYSNTGLSCSFSADVLSGPAPLTVTAEALATGVLDGITYHWVFSDGENDIVVDTYEATVEQTLPAGLYDVTLTVENSYGNTAESVQPGLILSAPPVIYVDAANGEYAKFPFGSAVTATPSLTDALSACVGGCEIRVKGGAYAFSDGAVIKDGVRIVGVDGPENTVISISSPYTIEIALELKDEGTEMTGITLENAYQQMLKVGTGSVATNCVFRNKSWFKNYTTGAAVQIAGGTLVDCVITNCNGGGVGSTGSSKGGAVYLVSGLVDRCFIVNNTDGTGMHNVFGGGGGIYVENGTVRNSIIAGNKGALHGSGIRIDNGSVENCTIADNGNSFCSSNTVAGVNMLGGTVVNSIIWGNYNQNGINNLCREDGYVSYTCASPLPEGTGNIAADPLFKDVSKGDYRLTLSSPCINAGDKNAYTGTSGDLDYFGMRRIRGRSIDMGFFEYQSIGTVLLLK